MAHKNLKSFVIFVFALSCLGSCKKQENMYHTLTGTLHVPYHISYQSGQSLDPEIERTIVNLKYSAERCDSATFPVADGFLEFAGYCMPHGQEKRILGKATATPPPSTRKDEGFICDSLSRIFESKRIDNYRIEIGEMIITKGTDFGEKAWRIEIHK